jgi:hypothetical protein
MQPTKPWSLLIVAAVGAVVAWLVVSSTFPTMAPLPWTAVPALGLLALGEFLLARNLGPRLHGRPGAKPIQPMAVPRVVALAKASSLAAAVIGGVAAGFAAAAAGSLPARAAGHDVLTSTSTFTAAVLLAGAALYLEHCCRIPEDPDAARYVPPPPPPTDPFH